LSAGDSIPEQVCSFLENLKETGLDKNMREMRSVLINYMSYGSDEKSEYFQRYKPKKMAYILTLIKREKDKLQNIVFFLDGFLANSLGHVRAKERQRLSANAEKTEFIKG
jgi:uncharacterized protein (DUF2225 family)